MITADKIDFNALKSAAKALNATGLLTEDIRTVGVGKEALANAFCTTIEAMSEEAVNTATMIEGKEELNEIGLMYEFLIGDEVAAETKAEEEKPKKPAKEAKPPKEPKPAKEAKPKKEVTKDMFGSIVPSKSADMNKLIAAGTTIEELTAKAGVTRTAANGHIKFLEKERGVIITRDGDNVKGEKK